MGTAAPADQNARLNAAVERLQRGDFAGVETELADLRAAGHPRVDYLLGLAAMGRGDAGSARTLLEHAANACPDDAGIHANWVVCLHRNGEHESALAASDHAIALAPAHADNHFNRGLILFHLNRYQDAAESFERATKASPRHAGAWARLGETRHALGQYLEAEMAYRRALDATPDAPWLHAALSAVLHDAGLHQAALDAARRAIELDPALAKGWIRASDAQRRLGQLDEALHAAGQALALEPDDGDLLKSRGLVLQMLDRLDEAAIDLTSSARLRFAPGPQNPAHARELRRTSIAKLRHDIEQFEHLAERGLLRDARALADLHRQILDDLPASEVPAQSFDLPSAVLARLAGSYNRMHYLAAAPAVPDGALNPQLDPAAIEAGYFRREPGITWIDDLLTPQALSRLVDYCADSTLWFDFHHVNGYLGAFFEDGFAAPLLLQIAAELRTRFPRIFRDHPLTQMWAFKYDSRLDGIELHADIAAVNLNFWITPDSANLDPQSGGLVVWDQQAPSDWGFDDYNTSTWAGQRRIQKFLDDSGARAVRIPYRQNRAVLFNSDLFHRTDTIHFAEGYRNRRINITMLFGQRVGRQL